MHNALQRFDAISISNRLYLSAHAIIVVNSFLRDVITTEVKDRTVIDFIVGL